MTLLEMLDALELQIGHLRARHSELTAVLSSSQDNNSFAASKKAKKRKKVQEAPPKKAKPKARPEENSAPKERTVLGKRQALGRSLLQLRRLGAAMEPSNAESESPSEQLITRE